MIDDPVFAPSGERTKLGMADAECLSVGVLREDGKRCFIHELGPQRIAAAIRQQAERIVVAPARAGGIDDVHAATVGERLRPFEQRRDGPLPRQLGRAR